MGKNKKRLRDGADVSLTNKGQGRELVSIAVLQNATIFTPRAIRS